MLFSMLLVQEKLVSVGEMHGSLGLGLTYFFFLEDDPSEASSQFFFPAMDPVFFQMVESFKFP